MAVLERVKAALEGKASLQDVDQALQDSSNSIWTKLHGGWAMRSPFLKVLKISETYKDVYKHTNANM